MENKMVLALSIAEIEALSNLQSAWIKANRVFLSTGLELNWELTNEDSTKLAGSQPGGMLENEIHFYATDED